MDRLRRPGPVIALAIAAGLLCAEAGLGATPTAHADDSGRGASARGHTSSSARDDPGPRRGRAGGAGVRGKSPSGVPATSAAAEPCPWPWPLPPFVPPVVPVDHRPARIVSGNDGLIADLTPIVPVLPVPQAQVEVGPSLDVPPAGTDEQAVEGPVVAGPAAAVSGMPNLPVLARPAAARRPFAAVPAAPSPTPPRRPGPEPAPLRSPSPAASAPARLPNPLDLRADDLSTLIAMVLPGLAAIAGMTALGGLIGYRQARAGYLLRAAGAGRFAQ